MARLSIPTKAKLPSSLPVEPSNPAVIKSFSRLTRESLLSLALEWLDEGVVANATPYLARRRRGDRDEAAPDQDQDDADDLYPPCRSLDELRALYGDLQQQKSLKRDVVARILEGDWRHGVTLFQLAMADFAHLEEHPASQKWTAYKILPLKTPSKDANEEAPRVDSTSLTIPRFHPSTFIRNLQQQVLPDVKAHYHFHRPKQFPVLFLRIFVIDSPYNTTLTLSTVDSSGTATNFSSSRTIFLAFPDGSPSLYMTKSQATGSRGTGESKSLHSIIVNGVPKALSRPRERFAVKSTNLTSKNLDALLEKRGSGRSNASAGGWSIYANEKAENSPLDPTLSLPPLRGKPWTGTSRARERSQPGPDRAIKRARLAAQARFGGSALVDDGKGVERLEILMQDPFPASSAHQDQPSDEEAERGRDEDKAVDRRRSKVEAFLKQARVDADGDGDDDDASLWTPTVRLAFQGPHVFAGIRQLVEAGIVDGARMPGWMTGEDGVTSGVVRHGRIRGYKGSGL
ncbi:chl4 [Drechmeria coniospora]|uniref:Chl4 n=1 Tax=Drechmeria coniospora TaxID=98403 RepID=A0A151GDN7_DRECN|nr:chl4 [Drechmeria coniospora]KYK55217.1 chl4 [Drechmeria coniospora]